MSIVPKGIGEKNIAEMDAGLMKKYCSNRSGIDEENLAEIEAGLVKRILLNESGTFYKINIVFCAEFSETNCRAELSNAELSAPNCPRRIVLRRIVREPRPPEPDPPPPPCGRHKWMAPKTKAKII